MDWDGILQWSRMGFIGCCALLVQLVVSLAADGPTKAQPEPNFGAKLVEQHVGAEELAVYRAFLQSWFEDSKASINLSIRTEESDEGLGEEHCFEGVAMEPASGGPRVFRAEDLLLLGPYRFHLVDPREHEKLVKQNDPENGIGKGRDVDAAVENGFAHGLFTLGEVRFNRSHTLAVIAFRFHCGMLCGHGGTVLLKKVNGVWRRKEMCGQWVS
jgi:hypothetical protein